MPRFTDAAAAAALTEARGFVSVAARTLGCSRQALYDRLERSPSVRRARADALELTKDVAELKLLEAINEREAWAVCFYLKCQAKDRGYVERVDLKQDVAVRGSIDVSVEDARAELIRRVDGVADRLGSAAADLPSEAPSGNGKRTR